jgi:hypothetical protein
VHNRNEQFFEQLEDRLDRIQEDMAQLTRFMVWGEIYDLAGVCFVSFRFVSVLVYFLFFFYFVYLLDLIKKYLLQIPTVACREKRMGRERHSRKDLRPRRRKG